VSRNGLYAVVVEPATNSTGPFPAPFQIHLAGNTGVPRKITNDVPEYPRTVRQDTLFNHPAPRPQSLGGAPAELAETALFQFVNLANISQSARARRHCRRTSDRGDGGTESGAQSVL